MPPSDPAHPGPVLAVSRTVSKTPSKSPLEPPSKELDPTIPIVNRAVCAALGLLLLLVGCQQALPPEGPENRPPELNLVADPDNGPAPLTIELRAQASDPDGDTLSYFWEIDFELLEGQALRTVTFDEPGTYSVSVLVTDEKWDVRDEVEIIVYGEDDPEL